MLRLAKDKIFVLGYEIIMAILAFIAVSISFLDITSHISITSSSLFYSIDLCILIIFTADYFIRLFKSKDRKQFFLSNFFDLLAIIPFNSLFRIFRFARLLRLTRLVRIIRMASLAVLFKRLILRVNSFIRTNGLIYIIYLTGITIILGSFGIYNFELGNTVESFGDALWWSFVTATTVGYGDISPVTLPGRVIAAILMLTGIGFIGMLTGTISTFFINKKRTSSLLQAEKKFVDLSDLNNCEYKEVIRFIEFVKSKK
jgi:voltage-gated potassium channel